MIAPPTVTETKDRRQAHLESVVRLVAGTARVRLTAYSLSTLTPVAPGGPLIDQCAKALVTDIDALRSWYVSLADALVERSAMTQPPPGDDDERSQVVRCVRRALAAGDRSMVGPVLSLLWANHHLDNLRQVGADLVQPAAEFSSEGAPAHIPTPPVRSVA